MNEMNEGDRELLSDLKAAIQDNETAVEITDGYSFDYHKTINKIELYRANKFLTGDRDSEGYKKYFFNVVNAQAGNVTKYIDLDVKDVLFRSVGGGDRIKSSILTEMFRHYAKEKKFGVLLNKISEQLPIYGHVILRKYAADDIRKLNLRDVMWDQSVDSIHQSPYLVFKHYMQPWELDEMATNGWDKEAVKYVTDKAREEGCGDICVYEYMAEFENEYLGKEGEGYSRGVCFIATLDDEDLDNSSKNAVAVVYRNTIKEYPVKELKMFDVEGRALGLGIFEILFDLQERKNEIGNQRASSMRLSTKTLFQTRDSMIQSNIMDDVVNGEIIKVQSEITPIANQEKNLAAYNQEYQELQALIRNNANAQEVLTGENLPSGTPFRLAAMQAQNASALFGYIKEKFGLFLKEMVEDWILPSFTKEALKKQVLEVMDNDLIDELWEREINRRMNDMIKKFVLKNGYFPPMQDVETLKNYMRTSTKPISFAEIAEDFLDFEYTVDVVITDEQENTQQQIESLTNVLTLLAQNPAILTDPNLRKPFNEILEKTGISSRIVGMYSMPQQAQGMMPSPEEQAMGMGPGGPVPGVGGQPAGGPNAA